MGVTSLERLEAVAARTAEPNVAGFDELRTVLNEFVMLRMFGQHVTFKVLRGGNPMMTLWAMLNIRNDIRMCSYLKPGAFLRKLKDVVSFEQCFRELGE